VANKHRLRAFRLEEGLPNLSLLEEELDEMIQILLGRVTPPIDVGVPTLAEVANAYLGRLREIESEIHRCEREGTISRGSKLYKFRTGELRSIIDLTTKAYELGSRRMTWAQHIAESERFGSEM
jgi:hypothetical protein